MTLILSFSLSFILRLFPQDQFWMLLEEVEFEIEYIEKESTYVLKPEFSKKVKDMEGKEVEVKGYYIPVSMKEEVIILSKTNYKSCYFCGGGGPETVIEVEPKDRFQSLEVDDIITVKGKLRLNDNDIYRLTFILEDAEIID